MTALFDDYDADTDADLRAAADVDAQRAEAERKAQSRARKRRDKLVVRVDVLDELSTARGAHLTEARPTIGEVAQFLRMDQGPLQTLLRYRREEFLCDGWEPGTFEAPQDRWTDRAIIRAALLLEAGESETASEIRYHLGEEELPLVFSARPHQVTQCATVFERSMEVVGAVHGDASPAEVWRHLQDLPRYELQSMAVALAALVPDDATGVGGYLRKLSGKNGSVAHGLALLIPRPSKLLRRRRNPGRARWADMPGGVSVTAQR